MKTTPEDDRKNSAAAQPHEVVGSPGAEVAQQLASIVASADDSIVSTNLNGIIISWNHGAERLFGYTRDEAIGKPITLIIPINLHQEERAILERLRKGEKIEHYDTVRQRKDGIMIDVSLTVSPIRDSKGKVRGIKDCS